MDRLSDRVIIIGRNAKKYYWGDLDAEIWGRNGVRPAWVPRWNRMFNIHRRKSLEEDWAEGLAADIKWANENPSVPFYVIDEWPDAPSTIPFPRHELSEMPRPDYHAGSFDWMVAFAILLGFKRIDLHGAGLVGELGSPLSARPCLEYWCGYAEGRGISVTRANDCDLFYNYHFTKTVSPYGYVEMPLIEDRTGLDAQ